MINNFRAIKRLVVLLARSANLEFATEAAFNDNVNPRKVVSDTVNFNRNRSLLIF